MNPHSVFVFVFFKFKSFFFFFSFVPSVHVTKFGGSNPVLLPDNGKMGFSKFFQISVLDNFLIYQKIDFDKSPKAN